MRKRRLEILILAALVMVSTAEWPSVADALPTYQVADFAPQRVENIRDLGLIAAKLLIDWID